MLIQFSFENYRSFKKPTTFSMLASSGKENLDNTFESCGGRLLRSAAVFGANAAGKSNLMKAFVASIMILRTSVSRQLDEPIPLVNRFLFGIEDKESDVSFEYEFIVKGKRYIYGFSCNNRRITEEHLLVYNSQKPSTIFKRIKDGYQFTELKYKQELSVLSERNTSNKLFLATATAWNARSTRDAYLWFARCIDVYDYSLSPMPFLEAYESDMDGSLRTFTKNLLKESDINISDYSVESRVESGQTSNDYGFGVAEGVPVKRKTFAVNATHEITEGMNKRNFILPMQEESKGTQKLFLLSPQIKKALDNGYVFCVDELDSSLHPSLVLYLVGLFNDPEVNKKNAQLILTTHTTELLSIDIMRRDQLYFVDKENSNGISELYSLDDYSVRTREDVRKAYLNGRFGAIPNIV